MSHHHRTTKLAQREMHLAWKEAAKEVTIFLARSVGVGKIFLDVIIDSANFCSWVMSGFDLRAERGDHVYPTDRSISRNG